ncbi:MAG: UDP-3-O-acyl-N-acetylglucosamine deacetylase [Halioglobus sp.]
MLPNCVPFIGTYWVAPVSGFVQQHTLQRPVELSGIGVHTAALVRLALLPAMPNTGIVFRRVDLSPPIEIVAEAASVTGTQFATTLTAGAFDGQSVSVSTVEHLLAALLGLGVDNCVVELGGGEVPIMDGSAEPFVKLIQTAGLLGQPAPRSYLRVTRPIEVADKDKTACFLPHDGFRISFTIDFEQPVFRGRPVHEEFDYSCARFTQQICRARTFGFLTDVEALHSRGLALGGSLENAVVLDDHSVLNPEGLRDDGEFVQHKVLDAMGDLSLLGSPIIGEYRAHKAGHTLNHAAITALLAAPDAWERVTFSQGKLPPDCYRTGPL